jgi:hypothetical protein
LNGTGLGEAPVGSKNSCGFARVLFQEPAEPLTTLHRVFALPLGSSRLL